MPPTIGSIKQSNTHTLTEVDRDMGREWKVKLFTFVGGTSGSVHKEYIEKNLEELQVPKLKWKGIREGLVRPLGLKL
jgi:hypothetical protein